MKPWHCSYNPLEVIGAGQGGDLPFHLLQWLGSVRVFVSPRGGVQESSLSKAQGGMWWARKSQGLSLPLSCPSLLQTLVRDVQCCAFLECSQQRLGTFCRAGFRAHGPDPDHGSFCAGAWALLTVSVTGSHGPPSPVVVLCCWGGSGCSSIPVQNLCLFAVMGRALGSRFQ